MEKREKKANFSDRENLQLLEEVQKNYGIITQTSKVANMSARKRNAWLDIANSVNAIGGHGRAPAAVQKRWKDMRDAVKNRPKAASRTGAGPPVPPAPYEEVILQILGESTTVDGIVHAAAGDTLSMQETKSENDLTGFTKFEADNMITHESEAEEVLSDVGTSGESFDTSDSDENESGPINYINLYVQDAEQGDLISVVDHGDSLDLKGLSIIHPETTDDRGTIFPNTGLTDIVVTERETLAFTPLKGDHCQISGPAHVGNNGHAADEGSAVPQASKRPSSTICRGILKKRKYPNKKGEDCDSEDEVTLTKKYLKAQIDMLRAEKEHHDLEIERLKIENVDRKERIALEKRELELRVKKLEMELHLPPV